MPNELTWLPQVLRSAGLKVAEEPGWEDRGVGSMGSVFGVMCHHTANRNGGNMPSLRLLVSGRSDLRGPLSQLGLGRDGTYYVIAAGRCNHAGEGNWQGIAMGNTHFIGIEAENAGDGSEPWPSIQVQAYIQGAAAILRYVNQPALHCCGHREYAPHRKIDPHKSLDMDNFRRQVNQLLGQQVPPLVPIPTQEPAGTPGRRTLRRNPQFDPEVAALQRVLHLSPDGFFGGQTEAAVRTYQRSQGLVPDGIVGPKTWDRIDISPP